MCLFFQGYGAFTGFIMSMYLLYLLQQRKLSSLMSSYQIMRNTLRFLGDCALQNIVFCKKKKKWYLDSTISTRR